MATYQIIADDIADHERLDAFVANHIELTVSRSYIQKLCTDGQVMVNGIIRPAKYRVAQNDEVTVQVPDPKDFSEQALPVLYEDDNVIVINKPAGILTHSKGSPLDEFSVAEFMRSRTTDKPESNRPGIVHRLDRDTSGVIICAKTELAQSFLQRQFSDRKAKKRYVALLDHTPKQPEAIIRLPLERNPSKPQTFRVGINGKPAETAYKVIARYHSDVCLVELKPLTGRTHQLRVHMQYLGCPIRGDRLYGVQLEGERLCLHAASLEITVPGGYRHTFEAPLPKDIQLLIDEEKEI